MKRDVGKADKLKNDIIDCVVSCGMKFNIRSMELLLLLSAE